MSQEPEPSAMVAAPGEVLLLPPKRLMQDPCCPENLPVVPAMATDDSSKWYTLPPELVRRIADSFLATNDLDYYMCFRGVCPTWRAATDDPSSNTRDSCFHPHRWIILNEDFQGDGRRVLVNTATGRFLRKKLPVLLDYYVVGTSHGFFVLADKSPPHAARVFNPLTGCMFCFAAQVLAEVGFCDVGSCDDSSLELTLFCDSTREIYRAAPDSACFLSDGRETPGPLLQVYYDFFQKAAVGGVFAETILSPVIPAVCTLLQEFPAFHDDPLAGLFSGDLPGDEDAYGIQGFLVDLVGRLLLILKTQGALQEVTGIWSPFVLELDTEIDKLVPLQSISNHAIFIGQQRCMAVDPDKFPGIEANCVYYTEVYYTEVDTERLGLTAHIYKCNIKNMKIERISESVDFLKRGRLFDLFADRPFTIIHILSSYTINILESEFRGQ